MPMAGQVRHLMPVCPTVSRSAPVTIDSSATYGAVGIGVGSTTLGFGWSTGYIYVTVAKARRVVFAGALQPWVTGKDIVLELLRRWGAAQSQGMSVEFIDRDRQLPIAFRNTIATSSPNATARNDRQFVGVGPGHAEGERLGWDDAFDMAQEHVSRRGQIGCTSQVAPQLAKLAFFGGGGGDDIQLIGLDVTRATAFHCGPAFGGIHLLEAIEKAQKLVDDPRVVRLPAPVLQHLFGLLA